MRLQRTIRGYHPVPDDASLRARLSRAGLPVALLSLMAYFAYHAVEGEHGLLRLTEKRDARAALERELAQTREIRHALERDVALLRPESLDPDLLDERARAALGLADPDEITIFIDE